MNFQSQKKILEPILKNGKNDQCADCTASTPTCTPLIIQGHLLILVSFFAQNAQEPIEPWVQLKPELNLQLLIFGKTVGFEIC